MAHPKVTLKFTELQTTMGLMIAVADDHVLYLLEFTNQKTLKKKMERLRKKMHATIVPGSTIILRQIKSELSDFFNGKNIVFKTPVFHIGSDFQKSVWAALTKIPQGETRSYAEIATAINKPTACRAVANANGANTLAIIIPCHRVIHSDGTIGGYAGGVEKKEWLLKHERNSLAQKSRTT